jgi:hypothetical protein
MPWPGAHLDLALGATNTTVLLLSSVTCQMGVFAVERGQISRTRSLVHPLSWGLREWYVLTFLMGLYFDLGQGYEYLQLVREQGLTLSSSAYGSVFYIPTGFHGLHVAGGLVAFIFLLGRTYAARTFTHEQQVSAIVVSYYSGSSLSRWSTGRSPPGGAPPRPRPRLGLSRTSKPARTCSRRTARAATASRPRAPRRRPAWSARERPRSTSRCPPAACRPRKSARRTSAGR